MSNCLACCSAAAGEPLRRESGWERTPSTTQRLPTAVPLLRPADRHHFLPHAVALTAQPAASVVEFAADRLSNLGT